MRLTASIWVLFALLSMGGCTTYVRTNDPAVRLYLDDAQVGVGEAEISRLGMFGDAVLRAEAPDGRRVEVVLERRFTWVTAVLGLFSYGTGFVWAWQYPERIWLQVPEGSGGGWGPPTPEAGVEGGQDLAPNPWLNPS